MNGVHFTLTDILVIVLIVLLVLLLFRGGLC